MSQALITDLKSRIKSSDVDLHSLGIMTGFARKEVLDLEGLESDLNKIRKRKPSDEILSDPNILQMLVELRKLVERSNELTGYRDPELRIEYHCPTDKYGRCSFSLHWMTDYHPGHPDGEYRWAETAQMFFANPRDHRFPLPEDLPWKDARVKRDTRRWTQ